jgi:predicted RNA-binding protein with PIN domain
VSEHRLIIVDGYNLIHRTPTLRPGADRTLRDARAKLVNLLAWAFGQGDARFLVVFDGDSEGGTDEPTGRVEVRYSRPPEKADDMIRRLVEAKVDRGEGITVVTSDLEVARHARAMGADVALSDLFLASVLGPRDAETPEKPASMSRKDLEEWAEIFRSRRSAPEEPAGE